MILTIIASLCFFTTLPVYAAGNATFSINPSTVNVEAGDRFDVIVTANPNGEQIDTVRASLLFNPTLLRVEAATLIGPFDRSAPGNFIDNGNGKVYWGGFRINGSIGSQSDVLKVTFAALKEGKGQIEFGSDAKLIANGEEKIALKKSTRTIVTVKAVDQTPQVISVTSSTHADEDKWYKEKNIEMAWIEVSSENPIVSYKFAFDDRSDTDPKEPLGDKDTSKKFEEVGDGVHYFHLKAIRKDGTSTKTIHRRILIDSTVPNKFELSTPTNKLVEGESLWFTFATIDETSGIADYQISMNNSAFQSEQSPLEIIDLKTGTYFFRAAAIDRAGNTIYAAKSIRVYPAGTDLGRPEGYSLADAADATANSTSEKVKESKSERMILLITLVLVALAVFGIIYALKKRKN